MKLAINKPKQLTATILALALALTPKISLANSLSSEFLEGAVITEDGQHYSAETTIMSKKYLASAKAIVPMVCQVAKSGEIVTIPKEIALRFEYRELDKNGASLNSMVELIDDSSLLFLDGEFSRTSAKLTSRGFWASTESVYSDCTVDIQIPLNAVGKRKTPVYFGETSPFGNEADTKIQLRFDQGKLIDLALDGTVICTRTGKGFSGMGTWFDLSSTPSTLKMVAQYRQQFTVQIAGDDEHALLLNGYINKKNNTIRVTFKYQEISDYHGGVLCKTEGALRLEEGNFIKRGMR